MLKHLLIRNYALIRELEMTPSGSLNVITGETGAGKSIMLGAIGLLLGNRADTKALWDEQEKCVTEGTFDLRGLRLKKLFSNLDLEYDDETIIRREINPAGKSRAFINDLPVTLDILRQVGQRLMDIHSQHETLELGKQTFQLELLDAYAGNQKITEAYELAWREFQHARAELSRWEADAARLKAEADYVNFQLTELTQAQLEEGEQGRLEEEQKVLEHAEEIKQRLVSVLARLSESDDAVANQLAEVRSDLSAIAPFSEAYQKLLDRFNTVRLELADIANEAGDINERVEFEPARFEAVQQRLSLLYQLQKKHRVNEVADLLKIQAGLEQRAATTRSLDDTIARLQQTLDAAGKQVAAIGEQLSDSRTRVMTSLKRQLASLLHDLGMPDARVEIHHQRVTPNARGLDEVDLLFSANKGVAPRPLNQVASGGEFSRLMFAVKYVMAEKAALPTLVLDEIDTGVSGEVALKLGSLMKAMARNHQLIAISHLPQIAAKADTHYLVFKDQTGNKAITGIRLLAAEERVDEIAKMIGGAKPTPTARESARELMTI
ncbi:MAG: DNA repair protein RecN [Cyclobacteriaceae bacterium]|jgi:DNA repair protein RecN (Recombination protein N)|nr:DNA repair protein RecN [Flammeovirgaceae bacterium]